MILVAGQRTHVTTFRALKVTSQVATLETESAVYDDLVATFAAVVSIVYHRTSRNNYRTRNACPSGLSKNIKVLFAAHELN